MRLFFSRPKSIRQKQHRFTILLWKTPMAKMFRWTNSREMLWWSWILHQNVDLLSHSTPKWWNCARNTMIKANISKWLFFCIEKTLHFHEWICFLPTGLRFVAFPSNQFAGQMPEADGDEIMKHLKEHNVEFDLVMAKVRTNSNLNYFYRKLFFLILCFFLRL